MTVAGGATSGTFPITVGGGTAGRKATIRATYRGISFNVLVTVRPLLVSLKFSPGAVVGGTQHPV